MWWRACLAFLALASTPRPCSPLPGDLLDKMLELAEESSGHCQVQIIMEEGTEGGNAFEHLERLENW